MKVSRTAIEMKGKSIMKLLIALIVLLMAVPIMTVGCQEEEGGQVPPQ